MTTDLATDDRATRQRGSAAFVFAAIKEMSEQARNRLALHTEDFNMLRCIGAIAAGGLERLEEEDREGSQAR